jgi:hypothetical protein
MSKFAKARVELQAGSKLKSITVTPESGVQAIFFNGAEKQFGITAKPKPLTPGRPGVTIDGQLTTEDGPSGVCYMFNGQLVCW